MKKSDAGKSGPKSRAGWIMLGLCSFGYLLTFAMDTAKGEAALHAAADTLATIAPILLAVVFLMALMNTYIDPKSIKKHLGKASGLRGWSIALFGGVASHGSTLIWYPMLAEFRTHGVRDALIVAFLYARAIKVPWLPVMVGYFGLTFTITLCVYIIAGAWVQGVLAQKLLPTPTEGPSK